MILQVLTKAPVALLPVLVFLVALVYFDSFKLVRLRSVLLAIAVGGAAAGASYFLNGFALERLQVEFTAYSRYVSPWIEELLKAAILIYLVRTRRIGMLVDAAIFGFAIGAGFSLVENLYYLASRPDARIGIEVIRGFGTAIMHGGATAIFAIVSVALAEKRPDAILGVFLPGLVAAVTLHSAYNHLLARPVVATLAILVALPPIMHLVFQRSEQSLRDWLDSDLDSDIELLELINSDEFSDSHAGQYLHSLRERFRGEVVADMLCYLRLHVELALRAKGVILMRESGLEAPIDDETREKLKEMQYLERSIGRTGQLAMRPVLQMSSKDLWQIYVLGS
ncbi:MAG: PrsW family intramembrane metalloprotease [Gammaproteobacteria bacterium]|nr:PrsW family intramembrane metalloprotease [Gammaproteobacteria bacterium]